MSVSAARTKHYRNKAEEVRIIADTMKDPQTRQILLNAAEDYLTLARAIGQSEVTDPKSG